MSGDKKITLLFLTHWAANCGGAEYSLVDIVSYAAKVANTYLITTENGELLQRIAGTGCTTMIIPCTPNVLAVKRDHIFRNLIMNWNGIAAFLRYVYGVRKRIHTLHPDCIHANVPKSHMTLLLLKLVGYRGRCIVHMRELFSSDSIVMHVYRLLFRITGKPEIIAISNAVRDSLPISLHRYITVIYNGVTVNEKREYVTRCKPITFLFLGRIVPWKGCDLLIKIFEKVITMAGFSAARLTLVGDTSYWGSSYRKHLETVIKKSHAASLIELSEKTDSPMAILRKHDILCLPSQNEPFGRVAAEAQGDGMPVIGFASGGLPEIIVNGSTGILVPDQNGDAFANAMLAFIENPALIVQMGSKGRERALAMFDKRTQIPIIVRMILGVSDDTLCHDTSWGEFST